MLQARRSINDPVALVFGGGDGVGRAAALLLSAKGARVVLGGSDERAIARVVGEITCGGGAARHLAGDVAQRPYAEAAVTKAIDAFGSLAIVLVSTDDAAVARSVATVVSPHLAPYGRVIFLTDTREARAGLSNVAADLAAPLEATSGTVNGVVWHDRGEDDVERAAEVVAFLCTEAADGITGEILEVKGRQAATTLVQ